MDEIEFPVEFIVEGVPLSLSASARSRRAWKAKVKEAARRKLPDQYFCSEEPIALTIYYFADTHSTLDVDNMIKSISDALAGVVFCDDKQVKRVLAQRFAPGSVLDLRDPTPTLLAAVEGSPPLVFVRIHANLQVLE